MAEFNFGKSTEEPQDIVETIGDIEEAPLESVSEENVTDEGLTMEEIEDPNKIKVSIVDYNTPLVVLFGPPACGKTMTLVRLTRYLKMLGLTVSPITSFRPKYDKHYEQMCDDFDTMVNSEDAAKATDKINFMLVMVMDNGKPLCQILEGPGEYYFNPDKPKDKFPKYVNSVINSQNRKIWAIMLEPDGTSKRMSQESRRNYVDKIKSLKTRIKARDKVVFVFNKIDETPYVVSPGQIKEHDTIQQVEYLYPSIFEPFKNQNPITKFFQPYRFDFVPFQTGDFTEANDGTLTYDQGPDEYPARLWRTILKRIRG